MHTINLQLPDTWQSLTDKLFASCTVFVLNKEMVCNLLLCCCIRKKKKPNGFLLCCDPLVLFRDPIPATGSLTSKKNITQLKINFLCVILLFLVTRLGFEPKTPTLKV